MLYAVWGQANNNVIGVDNKLPWHIPKDLEHFKLLTLNQSIIMGRKTWESLPNSLPNRECKVVSNSLRKSSNYSLIDLQSEIDRLYLNQAESAYIIGGAQILEQALDYMHMAFVTKIDLDVDNADTFAPNIPDNWHMVNQRREYATGEPRLSFETWVNPKIARTATHLDHVYAFIKNLSENVDGSWSDRMLRPKSYNFLRRFRFVRSEVILNVSNISIFEVTIKAIWTNKLYKFEVVKKNGVVQEIQRQRFHVVD